MINILCNIVDVHKVMITVVGNEHDEQSSIPVQGCLHYT